MILNYPVSINYKITQPFGFENTNHPVRKDFYSPFDNKHPGIDIELPIGTEILISHDGIVVRNEFHKGMGNVLGTRFGNIVILYAHLSKTFKELGEIVKQGEILGLSGNTGEACPSPHLHFELRGISKNSLKEMVFEPKFGTELEQFKNEFIYKVNNQNTKKTLLVLSKMFFGSEDNWKMIEVRNKFDFEKEQVLKDGVEITIPNYI